VVALDFDAVAVDVTRENAVRNGVRVDARIVDVLRDALPDAHLLVANIELAAVGTLLHRWPGSAAITSGYLARDALGAEGWERSGRVELDGWAADRWRRSP
jgi:ribosomal protein L11 methylase PrmA